LLLQGQVSRWPPVTKSASAPRLLIDLHPNGFQPGDVAITTIAYLDVHLWQLDDAPSNEFRSVAQLRACISWNGSSMQHPNLVFARHDKRSAHAIG
jgi:hypothetical protein